MPFMVDQMVYTNLPNSGFRLLTSSDVPHAAEEVFVKDIVHQLWDAYNPPKATEQSVFVLQIAPTATLFGWIYNDGVDEMGRTSIPYFSCYYHTDELTTSRLEDIVTILGKGPLNYLKPDWLARHTLTRLFVTLPDSYQPARRGVMIASPDLAAMVARVESQELIKYHAVSDGSSARLPGAGHSTHSNELSLVNKTEESALSELLHTDNIGKVVIPQTNLKTTVPQLNAKPPQLNPKATTIQLNSKTTTPQLNPKATTIQSQNLDFETAVLRSFDSLDLAQVTQLLQSALEINPPLVGFMLFDQDVKPLTSFIGDHARLHKHCQEPQLIATVQQCSTLVNESRENLGLDSLQHIALHMGNGHLVFSHCFLQYHLLTFAETMLTGLLEVEIKRLTKQLAAIALGETGDQEGSSSPPPLLASFLPKTHLPKTQTQASEADANSEDILYRGRRLRSKVRKILSRISP